MIYSMYTFMAHISVLLLASLNMGVQETKTQFTLKFTPFSLSHIMYSRSVTTKAFKRKKKKNILAPGT